MKLLKLTLENLNSFQRKIELDFAENRHLKDASLLAITGPTGSGKTTLLDALCVALYNRTPRLSSTGNQNPGNLLSQGKTEGFAEIIFEANGTSYLSEWRASRKRNGELNTPKVLLKNYETEELISERRSSHSSAVQEILGLDFESFSRSVLLAQGQFAAFLKADVDARRKILEATTGVDIYDQLRQPLNAKTEAVRGEYEKVEAALNGIPGVTSEEIERVQAQQKELKDETQSLEGKQKKIQQQIEKEKDRSLFNQQLTDAQAHRKQLVEEQSEIDQIQSEFDNAQRAARIRPEAQVFQKEKQNFEDARSALA
ncbi:AAA family ATPase, partial [Candidatus Poribacteria bacterium]|nr:AAA family ATPase [Candidatus Poribacteria bacterium]